MKHEYPLSKTQITVLNALNIVAAENFAQAEKIFETLGIVVSSRREGRQTIPSITVLDRKAGILNAYGEGEIFTKYPTINTSAISQWIV